MAKIASNISIPGIPGVFTAYKQKKSDKVILRRKTGPTSEQIKNSSQFDLPRRHGKEFGGRSTTIKRIRTMLSFLARFGDQDMVGRLNTLLKAAQELDTTNKMGERSVLLSKNPRLLEGFNFNEDPLFDSIIRNPINYAINKQAGTARLDVPALIPGVNLFVPPKFGAYALVPLLSVIPDFHFTNGKSKYTPAKGYESINMIDDRYQRTTWYSARKGSPAGIIHLKLPDLPPDTDFSLMVAIGVSFNYIDEQDLSTGEGTAKVLGMA